ncbi:MAG: hypothetical protein JKP95_02260 [Oceanicaulis sp.]|nr:hypothetical protein [Oceanicaulis sp.]
MPALYDVIWRANGAPDWGGRTGYVFMFSLFFGVVFIWAALAAFIAACIICERRSRSITPWRGRAANRLKTPDGVATQMGAQDQDRHRRYRDR